MSDLISRQDRDCENCVNHADGGCTKWDCEYVPKVRTQMSSADLISRQDAIDSIVVWTVEDRPDIEMPTDLVDRVNALPSAERKGKWYNKNEGIWNVGIVMTCTECGESFYEMPIVCDEPTYNFCPDCGADMRGEDDET